MRAGQATNSLLRQITRKDGGPGHQVKNNLDRSWKAFVRPRGGSLSRARAPLDQVFVLERATNLQWSNSMGKTIYLKDFSSTESSARNALDADLPLKSEDKEKLGRRHEKPQNPTGAGILI